jgi:hypothetical protein
MRLRVDDPSYVSALVSFLRERSCIAYVLDDQTTIEVIRPHSFGQREVDEIGAILRTWQMKLPGARFAITE